MVPQHRSGAPVAKLGDDFRESPKEAIDRARGHSGFSRQPTYCERLGAAAPNDSTCDLEQLLPCLVIVFPWDPTAHLIAALDKAGSLGERARGAVQVGRTRGTSDLPNLVRAGHGPGWALAGDAGLVMDPITGLGIGHGLRDAELLSHAVLKGLGGAGDLPGALTRYEKQRNRETKPAFNWTLDVATLRGVNEIEEQLFRRIGADEAEASQFFGMLTGVVPMRSFFSPAHLMRLIGVKDFLRLARARSR